MRKERVRIVSCDARYRKEPYPALPVYNERMGTYITGQHIDPSDTDTFENLTLREMMGEDKLSDEKRKKFPHVIIPEHRIPIQHLRWLDLSVNSSGKPNNPKDYAEYKFFLTQDFVAESKGKVKSGYHYFYIENLEQEATERISNRDARYQAEKKIREEVNITKYKEIGILLNYLEKDFSVNVNGLSSILLQDKLLDACEKYPQSVLKCFSKESEESIFILKAVEYGIIQKKGKSFVDGQQYLGDTVDEVKKFLRTQDGGIYKRRWINLIDKRENSSSQDTNKFNEENMEESLLGECSFAIVKGDFVKAKELFDEVMLINPNSPKLAKIRTVIEKGLDPVITEDKSNVNLVVIPEGISKEERDVYEKINNYASNVVKLRAGKEGLETAGKSEREIRKMLINKELDK